MLHPPICSYRGVETFVRKPLTKITDGYIEKMVIDEEREFSVYHTMRQEGRVYSDHNAIEVKVKWQSLLHEINEEKKIKVMTSQGYERL